MFISSQTNRSWVVENRINSHFSPHFVIWLVSFHRYTRFGGPAPNRPVEDLAFSVARFIQNNGSFVNYYMVRPIFTIVFLDKNEPAQLYNGFDTVWFIFIFCNSNFLHQYHGGTNFGRTATGRFVATTYDYDAPIDEYGMIFDSCLLSSPIQIWCINFETIDVTVRDQGFCDFNNKILIVRFCLSYIFRLLCRELWFFFLTIMDYICKDY